MEYFITSHPNASSDFPILHSWYQGKSPSDLPEYITTHFYSLNLTEKEFAAKYLSNYAVLCFFSSINNQHNEWAISKGDYRPLLKQQVEMSHQNLLERIESWPSSLKKAAVEALDKAASAIDKNFITKVSLNSLRIAGLYGTPEEFTGKCPDHTTVRMMKAPNLDRVYVCPIDGKTYDYNIGFVKNDGTTVQGTSIQDQIPYFIGNKY